MPEALSSCDVSLSVEVGASESAAPSSGACAVTSDGMPAEGMLIESVSSGKGADCSCAPAASVEEGWTGSNPPSPATCRETVGDPAPPTVGIAVVDAVLVAITGSG
jgi:hypothetical protein